MINNLTKMKDNKNFKNILIYILPYMFAFGVCFFVIFKYLNISIGQLPLMDYWLNRDVRIERTLNDFKWEYIIYAPHGIHWNPLSVLADYVFINIFKCDNRAYVYAGFIMTCLTMLLVIKTYKRNYSTDNGIWNFVGLFTFLLTIINLNQWEILTIFCNFAFMTRIFIYLLLFDYLDTKIRNGNIKWSHVAIISISSIFVINFISQAYYPGFVVAMICVMMVEIIFVTREKIKEYGVISLSLILGTVICILCTVRESVTIASDGGVGLMDTIKTYVKGIILMLGSTIIHVTDQGYEMKRCYVAGTIILILSIIAVVLFFVKKIYCKTSFPLACMIYAFVSIVVIIMGRVNVYGLGSVTSSRYVVETTIGLLGLVQIYWLLLSEYIENNKYNVLLPIIVITSIAISIIHNNYVEYQIGPARKQYNNTMVNLALDIDNVSDEQLAIFQAPAQEVRDGIATMKKYKLGLWRD